jgi:hypothetical protein
MAAIAWDAADASASGLTRIPVGADIDTLDGAVSFKQGADSLFSCGIAEVPHKDIFRTFGFLY